MSKYRWDDFYWGDEYTNWGEAARRFNRKKGKITPKAVNWVSTNILQKIREEYEDVQQYYYPAEVEEEMQEIVEMIEEGDEELAEALEMTVKELQEAFEKGGLEWLWNDLYEDMFDGGDDE